MTTQQIILYILNNKTLPGKAKFFILVEIVSTSLLEKYFLTADAHQQIQSEILYLMEKSVENGVNEFWIKNRLNLLRKTLLEQNIICLRSAFEVGIDYLENMDSAEASYESTTPPPKHRKRGWQGKTYRRFERIVLKNVSSSKKKKFSQIFFSF